MTTSDWIDKIIGTRTATLNDTGESDWELMELRAKAARKLYGQQVQHVLAITPVSGDDIAIAKGMP